MSGFINLNESLNSSFGLALVLKFITIIFVCGDQISLLLQPFWARPLLFVTDV